MRKPVRTISVWPVLAGFLLLVLLVVSGWVWMNLFRPLDISPEGYRVRVDRGTGYQAVFDRLDKDGKLRNRTLAKAYFRFLQARPLQMGVYQFKPGLSPAGLLRQLSQGEGLIYTRITVIEGTTFAKLREQLAANPDIRQTLRDKSDSQIMSLVGSPVTNPEGLFAPDTYVFVPGDSDELVYRKLYEQQKRVLEKAWAARAPGLPYRTPYEALIMASIVEKETGNAAERPKIAGLFVRRLQQGMRLQTDPTVIYGLGKAYNGNLRKIDLITPTPYNTYRIDGLPPTPIALPGKAAIEAALNPEPGDSLYFVARGDGSGTHIFSADLKAHNAAVRAYIENTRQRKAQP
ncbi:MAG TPA: endolytic transglycosylase MltG [Fluviicoccus sp.]|nr:endolytic transglycosylase MltG [Fluviicoccus sp.]